MAPSTRPTRRSPRTANGRRSRSTVARIAAELDRYRQDAGIPVRRLAAAASISQGHLSMILAGRREPSISVLTAIATALGGDLSIRFYPQSGPVIRDAIQGRILEELLRIADPAWQRLTEVAVVTPVRGFIDLVLVSAPRRIAIATEIQSRIDRIEQTVRWAEEKARSLPSADAWRPAGTDVAISRLLVVRSTPATRDVARRFEATLAAAYPARAADVFAALTSPAVAWPGSGILWADVRGDAVRILPLPPRGIALGR